jgi:hypothetical protein
MKWFTGRFDVERVTIPITCRHCDATGEALLDTYSSPVWPSPAVWCQPPEGWALLLLERLSLEDLPRRIFARCGSCRPQPPAYLTAMSQLRFPQPPREHLSIEDLRAVVFHMTGVPASVRRHAESCEICRDMIARERAENPICQLDEETHS